LISLLIIFLSITIVVSAEEPRVTTAYNYLYNNAQVPADNNDLALTLLAFSTNTSVSDPLNGNLSQRSFSDNLITNAYSVIALNAAGKDSTKYLDNITAKKITYTVSGINWFLQIDSTSSESTGCNIAYDSNEENITLRSNKTYSIDSSSTTSCFIASGYWLNITQACITKEFSISCNKTAYVSLPFKSGNIWNIPSKTFIVSSSPISVKIETYCLASSSGNCDALGTLWATYALSLSRVSTDREIASSMLPYLVSSDDNAESPVKESLLYLITGTSDYANIVLNSQYKDGYWRTGTNFDPYYTAVASFALAQDYASSSNITKAKYYFNSSWSTNWGNQSTALMLYSFFLRNPSSPCEKAGMICNVTIPSKDYVENKTSSCQPTGGSCWQLGSCRLNNKICNLSMEPNYVENSSLECGQGSCWQLGSCNLSGKICNRSMDDLNYVINSSLECGQGFCWQPGLCKLQDGICNLSMGNPNFVINSSLECGQGFCWQLGSCNLSGKVCNLSMGNLNFVQNPDFECGQGSCWELGSCKLSGKTCSMSMDPNFVKNDSLECGQGYCWQLGSCILSSNRNVCNLSSMYQNYFQNLDFECGQGSCWQPNQCYALKNQGLSCESACDPKTQVENSTYAPYCGRGSTCCQETLCAQYNGTCKTSGNPDEVENFSLTPSCSIGKCYVKSPCAMKNLNCMQGSCSSGYKQKSSTTNKYQCGTGAVCCEIENPPVCPYSCNAACAANYGEIGNFACAGGDNLCCQLQDTCSVNTGYSCKPSCSDNETEATNLNCMPGTGGTCCKPAPEKQCQSLGHTCRSGTTCLSNEKVDNYGCVDGNVCCEALPANVCVDIYGFTCKHSCLTTESQLSYSCLSGGVCCEPKDTVIPCQTIDDCYRKQECNNQLVTDIFGKSGKCEYSRELSCSDNFDNDGDGLVDSEDPDCPKTCSSAGFTCCSECEPGYEQSAYDISCSNGYCCDKCKSAASTTPTTPTTQTTKSNILIVVLIAVLVIGIGAAVYMLQKNKKKKPSLPGVPGAYRPPVRPYMPPAQFRPPIKPMQVSQQQINIRPSEPKPRLTKQEEDLEETLKKLKKISEK